MASILEFRTLPASARPNSLTHGEKRPAEIVVFPGVRYERTTDDAAPVPEQRSRRDPLERDG